jgi:hypothetical protein
MLIVVMKLTISIKKNETHFTEFGLRHHSLADGYEQFGEMYYLIYPSDRSSMVL